MVIALIILMFISHSLALTPAFRKIRSKKELTIRDFAFLSIILYYDIGLIIEMISGVDYYNPFFTTFFSQSDYIKCTSLIILIFAPWLIFIGSSLSNNYKRNIANGRKGVRIKNKSVFLLIFFILPIILSFYGSRYIISGMSIWQARSAISNYFKQFIIILYLPLHFLAFFVQHNIVNIKYRSFWTIYLALTSMLSTLSIGQRTNFLLPILIIAIFSTNKISFFRMFIVFAILLVMSSVLLPLFKWQYSGENSIYAIGDFLKDTIFNDIYRLYILAETLKMSPLIGSSIMPYPGSGYIYSLLFYTPRRIFYFKGESTARYFTSYIANLDIKETTWVFGVGFIEELILNFGVAPAFIGIIFYGYIIGLLERLSQKLHSTYVPLRLAALWLCGYNLPAILLTFGTMTIVNVILEEIFIKKD